jgi:hypothetical protein
MSWTIKTLKEHFEKILDEKDKALAAALIAVKEENRKTEIAAEKRFELLNELRSGVATKDQLYALEKAVEDLKTSRDKGEGKGLGINQLIAWIIAGTAVIGFLIKIYSK